MWHNYWRCEEVGGCDKEAGMRDTELGLSDEDVSKQRRNNGGRGLRQG